MLIKSDQTTLRLRWSLAATAFVCFILVAQFGAHLLWATFAAEPEQPKPALRLAGRFTGAGETEGIKLTSTVGAFSQEFQVESIEKEVKDLRISVVPFTGPNSNLVETMWTVNGQPGELKVTVPAADVVNLRITASLLIEGAYDSVISLIYNNRRWSIPIKVTRTRPVPTVDIPTLEAVRNVSSASKEDVSMRMTLRENAGQEVRLSRPILLSLLLVEPNKTKVQALYDDFSVMDDKGGNLDESFILKPRETKSLRLVVKGLRDTGEFNGSISISGPDVGPVNQTVTIYRKESWLFAALLIGLGVAASFLIRLYIKTGRPRMIRQRRAALVLSELEDIARGIGELSDVENETIQELRRRLNDLYEDIELITSAKADDVINEVDRKLDIFPKWVSGRRVVDALQPPDLQGQFRDKLLDVKVFMLKTQVTVDETTTIETLLDKLEGEITAAKKSDLTKRLADFGREVNNKRKETSSADVRLRLTQEIDPRISEISNLLNQNNLEESRVTYNEARVSYAHILADDLTASLPQSPPRGFDGSAWDNFKSRLIDSLMSLKKSGNPELATEAYENTYNLYLRELIQKMLGSIKTLTSIIDGSKSMLSTEEIEDYKRKLQAIASRLDSALEKLDSELLREARQGYEAARQDFEVIITQGQSKGIIMKGTDGAATATATTGGSIPEPFDLPFWVGVFHRKKRERPSPDQTERHLFLYDLIFTAFVLLAAVLLGLKILWADNATWGGFNEYFTAVLWGLGLHQVSGVASEGVAGWASKISK